MTNFDNLIRARQLELYDYGTALDKILDKIHTYEPLKENQKEAEIFLVFLRSCMQIDMDILVIKGSQKFDSYVASIVFPDQKTRCGLEDSAVAVAIFDVLKDYTNEDLIQLYEIREAKRVKQSKDAITSFKKTWRTWIQ